MSKIIVESLILLTQDLTIVILLSTGVPDISNLFPGRKDFTSKRSKSIDHGKYAEIVAALRLLI